MKKLLFVIFTCISLLTHAQTTVIVVRHAEKEMSSTDDPALSDKGEQRAQVLDHMLGEVTIDHIFSTRYRRTIQTVTPIAMRLDLKIRTYDPGAMDSLVKVIREYSGQTIIVAGHSNTVPSLLNELTETGTYRQLPEDEYDNLYIVTLSGKESKVICLKYGNGTN